jgi:hypothetical protein
MANRTPPVPPNKDFNNIEALRKEQLEKVEKISSVNEDETKRSPFRQMIEKKNEEAVLEELPTPFELFRPKSEAPPATTVSSKAVAASAPQSEPQEVVIEQDLAPEETPPPFSTMSSTSKETPPPPQTKAPTLPQSTAFWETTDEPPDLMTAGPLFQESPYSAVIPGEKPSISFSQMGVEDEGEDETTAKGELVSEEPSPKQKEEERVSFRKDPKDKKVLEEETSRAPIPTKQVKKEVAPAKEETQEIENVEKKKAPLKVSSTEEKVLPPFVEPKKGEDLRGKEALPKETPLSPFSSATSKKMTPEKTQEEERKRAPTLSPKEAAALPTSQIATPRPFEGKKEIQEAPVAKKRDSLFVTPESKEGSLGDQSKDQRRDSKTDSLTKDRAIVSPTITPFPQEIAQVAQTATTQASPFLSPEALSIYFQMIGTITAMIKPNGDSHTEFVLNSSSFANSKFFGSTITIDKFATAPHQINIRLTGSQEAVTAFNQNIPSLMNAFQKGNFAFTVNRIDASYEKLVHRKEKSKESNS